MNEYNKMEIVSTKSQSCTLSETSPTTSVCAKMKRLKIEESILFQSINKCVPECSLVNNEVDVTSYKRYADFKIFSTKTKESYKKLKLIFEDIKTSTSSKEMLKSLDIEDVRRSTLELENNIKAFKLHLQTELASLQSTEKQLYESLNENPISINNLKRLPRIQTPKYNEIVPSPVKMLMTSPFKCLEVQQFQEFMVNSPNRYGGWNEYHHNIFVNCWQKYFGAGSNTSLADCEPFVQNTPAFHLFLNDLLPKLHDLSEEKITSHVNWYSKYLYLKERQQKAINKWKLNRKIIKSAKVAPDVKEDYSIKNTKRQSSSKQDINSIVSDEPTNMRDSVLQSPNQHEVRCFVRKCLSDEIQLKRTKNETVQNKISVRLDNVETDQKTDLHFQKATKQWNLRVNNKNVMTKTSYNNVENLKKLRIPTWRIGL